MATSYFTGKRIILPVPTKSFFYPEADDMAWSFLQVLRDIKHNDKASGIAKAIEFVADFMNASDAFVAKMLVDQGLRAPREAFCEEFLDYVDKSLSATRWLFSADKNLVELGRYWDEIGVLERHLPKDHDMMQVKFFVDNAEQFAFQR